MNPLALVAYKELMPGSQVATRLQDLGYRVQTTHDLPRLAELVAAESPMLVLLDLDFAGADVVAVIAKLRQQAATAHIPIIAFGADLTAEGLDSVRGAGATLVADAAGIQAQLPQLLEAALRVE